MVLSYTLTKNIKDASFRHSKVQKTTIGILKVLIYYIYQRLL